MIIKTQQQFNSVHSVLKRHAVYRGYTGAINIWFDGEPEIEIYEENEELQQELQNIIQGFDFSLYFN